ncbi:MAG: GNAT family N-acetyltransferase [Peptoanaerobacter stomatis]|uniref:GNAT family N-acetyltransferase n=1 Tax=Peptoanaerobacter stomatis TaxID=796937 RepID=UPI003FA087AE
MEFTFANREDKKAVKILWKYCFTDTDEYIDYYFTKRYDVKNNYLMKKNNVVISSLMTNPYKIDINGNISDTAYIVGISCDATNRGRGYVSTLIKKTLKGRYLKGEDVSMLMPIDTNIYTRYGYANIADMIELDIPLERIKNKRCNDVEVKAYDESLLKDLIYVYSKSCENFGAYFVRDEIYFKNFIDEINLENGYVYLAYFDNEPIAYMVFYPKYELEKTGFVREIFSLSKSGYDKLLDIVKSHYTQIKNILLHTSKNSHLLQYFDNDNNIVYKIKPFIMSRVINVLNTLKNLNSQERFCIEIKDDIIEENNAKFEVYKDLVKKTEEKCNFSINIYDFTQLYFGYSSLDYVIFKNNISLEKDEYDILKKIFLQKDNYFNDYI